MRRLATTLSNQQIFWRVQLGKMHKTMPLYIAYGDGLTRLGQSDAAATAYNQALKIKPDSGYAYIGLARLALVQAQMNADVEPIKILLENARDELPRNSEVHVLFSQVHARLGETEASLQSAWLAKAHKFRSQPSSEVIEQMRSLSVTSDAYEARGNRFARQGDTVKAEAAYRKVLELRPGSAQDLANLAAVRAAADWSEAASLFAAARELEPDNAAVLSAAGYAEARHGNVDEARKLLDAALRISPDIASAHLALAHLDHRRGDNTASIEHFERALALDPSLYPAYLELGQAHAASGQLATALDAWSRLLMAAPEHSSGWRNSGFVRTYLGHYALAKHALKQAYTIDPTHAPTSMVLGWLLATTEHDAPQDLSLALTLATRLYRKQPRNPMNATLMAAAFAANREFDRAIEFAERAQRASKQAELSASLDRHLQLYREQQPISLPTGGCAGLDGFATVVVCSLVERG